MWHLPAPMASTGWLLLPFLSEIFPPDGSSLCSGSSHFAGRAEDSLCLLGTPPPLLPHLVLCPPARASWGRQGRASSRARWAGRAGFPGQSCQHAPGICQSYETHGKAHVCHLLAACTSCQTLFFFFLLYLGFGSTACCSLVRSRDPLSCAMVL